MILTNTAAVPQILTRIMYTFISKVWLYNAWLNDLSLQMPIVNKTESEVTKLLVMWEN